jgi:hypothetical protein
MSKERIKKMQEDDGNIFELIAEECYYDDLWLKEREEKYE